MKRIMVVVGLALMVVVGATACEPAVTFTAVHTEHDAGLLCGYQVFVVGYAASTSTNPPLVLQQTTHGEWVDVKGWSDVESYKAGAPRALVSVTAEPKTGRFSIAYMVDWSSGVHHLRVRSTTGHSDGFYVTSHGHGGDC